MKEEVEKISKLESTYTSTSTSTSEDSFDAYDDTMDMPKLDTSLDDIAKEFERFHGSSVTATEAEMEEVDEIISFDAFDTMDEVVRVEEENAE